MQVPEGTFNIVFRRRDGLIALGSWNPVAVGLLGAMAACGIVAVDNAV